MRESPWYTHYAIVRLVKDGRSPLLNNWEDRVTILSEVKQRISVINRDLLTRGSRIRVTTTDLGSYEHVDITISETGKSYRVIRIYREEPPEPPPHL